MPVHRHGSSYFVCSSYPLSSSSSTAVCQSKHQIFFPMNLTCKQISRRALIHNYIFIQYLSFPKTCYMFRLFAKAIIRHRHKSIRWHDNTSERSSTGSWSLWTEKGSAWLRWSGLSLGCTTFRWIEGWMESHSRCMAYIIYANEFTKTKQRAWRSQCFQRAVYIISRRNLRLGSSVLLLPCVQVSTIPMYKHDLF
jgi:hypothetical protein